MKNETIVPQTVPDAQFSRMSTTKLLDLARYLVNHNVYNRDTILHLVGALADRVEESQRLLATHGWRPYRP